jgi:N-acetylneuraminic acid mutarotase
VGGFGPEASAELYDPVTGAWQLTGSMSTPRQQHTATLLPNGKVLIAGGCCFPTSAELYDPSSGTWTVTGSTQSAHNSATATLLNNGKVLLVGGDGSVGSSLVAELYDTATGTWTLTGSPNSGRIGHTATLLDDGRVLVAGGGASNIDTQSWQSAELYDPTTGTWSFTGSMANAREDGHTATLLPTGKVLVAGGFSPSVSFLASAELFNPATGTWTSAGAMSIPRVAHTATSLQNGMVLVAGGGSTGTEVGSTSADLYDTASNTWSLTGSMSARHSSHTATRLQNGEVLVAGGGVNGSFTAAAELFTPPTKAAPPTCLVAALIPGPPTQLQVAVEAEGGLASLVVTEASNASVIVQTFSPGTTDTVLVTATKLDQTTGSSVTFEATDQAGATTDCDPALLSVGREAGLPRSVTLHHVARAESWVMIRNGTPGVTELRLRVNGHSFVMDKLTDGQTRTLDVSAAMRKGERNTITVQAIGPRGSRATVLVSDH